MTKFLASISDSLEAATILAAGADIVDIKDPGKGVLGAVEYNITKEIVKNINGKVLTSATIGDLPMDCAMISMEIEKMQSTGVDIIKVGIFSNSAPFEFLETIQRYTDTGLRIVLVFFADMDPQLDDFTDIADAGAYGVMLDTADKTKGSLRTILNDKQLGLFVNKAHLCNLLTGLAGSLKLTDIHPLLELKPDYLGFRSALCEKNNRKNSINYQSVHNIRAMIPVIKSMENYNSNSLTLTM